MRKPRNSRPLDVAADRETRLPAKPELIRPETLRRERSPAQQFSKCAVRLRDSRIRESTDGIARNRSLGFFVGGTAAGSLLGHIRH